MVRLVVLLAVGVSFVSTSSPADAQTSLLGTWSGVSRRDAQGDRWHVPIRLTLTRLEPGQVAGSSRFGSGRRCSGELTLVSQREDAYVLRDRRTAGKPRICTSGDVLTVRLVSGTLRARHRITRYGGLIRYTLTPSRASRSTQRSDATS